MDAMLSTSEVAELTGISLRHVKRLAASNKLPCEKTVNSNNRPKYLFPLSGLAALDPTLPQRYLAQHAQEGTAEGAAEPQNAKRGRGRPRKGGAGKTAASKPLEEYSTEERGEIAFWTQAVQDWRGYRAGYRDKAAADEAWLAQFRLDHPEVHITRKILYARQRAVLEDDLDGLVDGRGKARRGYCKIPAAAWDAFMYYYLDQRQSPIKQCYDQTIYFLEQHCPEALPVPDYTTFYRHVMADVPEPVKVMGREGPKAFYDRCSHYIRREYEHAMGIAESALLMAGTRYPIDSIYLNIVLCMICMSLKQDERAEQKFDAAWSIASREGYIHPFVEHHGILQGQVERALRKQEPETYNKIVQSVYRFSRGWMKIHNPVSTLQVTDALTPYEFSIAMLAAKGRSNKEIAALMGVSVNTVKSYMESIFEKLQISSRNEIDAYVNR